jgi:hypothetical protein
VGWSGHGRGRLELGDLGQPPCRRQRAGPPLRQPLKPVWSCGQIEKTDLLSIAVDQLNMSLAPMERTIFQLAHSTGHGIDVIAMSVPFATGIVVAVHVIRRATLLYCRAVPNCRHCS